MEDKYEIIVRREHGPRQSERLLLCWAEALCTHDTWCIVSKKAVVCSVIFLMAVCTPTVVFYSACFFKFLLCAVFAEFSFLRFQ